MKSASQWSEKVYKLLGIERGFPGKLTVQEWIEGVRRVLDNESTGVVAFHEFTTLAKEASELPFIVEEEVLLSAELNSRQWAKVVYLVLSSYFADEIEI